MSDRRPWFANDAEVPFGEWWWAVEHRRHPAFYLRALMVGDFAPGQVPLARHAAALSGRRAGPGALTCGTCHEVPLPEELDVVERATELRGFLLRFRDGVDPWPPPTDESTCYLCCDPALQVEEEDDDVGDEVMARVCRRCRAHVRRGR